MMKYLLLFISATNICFAGYRAKSNYKAGIDYSLKIRCEQVHKETCVLWDGNKHHADYVELSGNKIVIDSAKKSEYDTQLKKKLQRAAKVRKGKKKRKQCEDALSYITGFNEDSDASEAEIDAMMVEFEPIHNCLKNCHLKKCRPLIKAAESHPTKGDLAKELSEIVK